MEVLEVLARKLTHGNCDMQSCRQNRRLNRRPPPLKHAPMATRHHAVSLIARRQSISWPFINTSSIVTPRIARPLLACSLSAGREVHRRAVTRRQTVRVHRHVAVHESAR